MPNPPRDKRRAKLKADSQETMRQKLQFAGTLNAVIAIEDSVGLIAEGKAEGDIAAYRLLLDSKWKRLNKLLPDLKAVESKGQSNMEIHISTSYD